MVNPRDIAGNAEDEEEETALPLQGIFWVSSYQRLKDWNTSAKYYVVNGRLVGPEYSNWLK